MKLLLQPLVEMQKLQDVAMAVIGDRPAGVHGGVGLTEIG